MRLNEQIKTTSFIGLSIGLWLVVAPSLFLYGSPTARLSDIFTGLIIGFISLLRAFNPKMTGFAWIALISGAWLLFSPFLFANISPVPFWADILFGIVVVFTSLWDATESQNTVKRSSHRLISQ